MSAFKTLIRTLKSPITIGVFVVCLSVTVIVFASQVLYQRTVNLLTENLRERILTISITAAAGINADHLSALQVENDWQKPEWASVVGGLHKVKYSNEDIVYMYIFRKTQGNPDQMEFVADADSINPFANISSDSSQYVDVNRDGKIEPDGPDKLQWPGQPYPEAVDIPEAFEAYNGPLTSKDLYTDDYGTVITGYAPIRNGNGETVAVLATDIKADDFFVITTQTLRPFLVFIAFLTSIISILIIILIFTWRTYAKSLKKANDRLVELDRQKSEFVSFATHQLRSPLTAMKGYSSLILDGDYGQVNAEVKEAVSRIAESTRTLVAVVDSYLNISRIELGTMKYELVPIDLSGLVKDVVAELRPTIESSGLEYITNIAPDILVNADKDKLKQVLGNLIDNSMKYTPKGSVQVTLERVSSEGKNKILFSVKDTGIGMHPDVIPKLFEKFVRANNANKANIHGTGLGLFVAKEIVKGHNGRIWAESDGEGKGSRFFVEIPAA